MVVKLDSQYALPPGTKFRYEDFGGVVYQRTGDRLHFLTSRLAIKLLYLAGTGTVREIAARLAAGSSTEEKVKDHILKILSNLEELGIVYELEYGNKETGCPHMSDLAGYGQM